MGRLQRVLVRWIRSYQFLTILNLVSLVAMVFPLILYAALTLQRPPRTPLSQELFMGITYQRHVQTQPRPVILHTLTVDLTAPGIRVIVSPGADDDFSSQSDPGQSERGQSERGQSEPAGQTIARTASAFLAATQVQIAANGSFFYPFSEKTPWDYAPHSGDRTYPLGQTIAQGTAYAHPTEPWHPFCVFPTQRVMISDQLSCPSGTTFALSGGPLLLLNGQPVQTAQEIKPPDKPYGRTILATNRLGTRLWLVAIDGKQPFYSEGMTIAEATDFVRSLGADDALNLDGGGSTTLVQATPSGPRLLNAPIHTKIPMRERPIANHIGIYAQPR